MGSHTDNRIHIELTRDDLRPIKSDLAINKITLNDFTSDALTHDDILKAHTITYIEGANFIVLKHRDKFW